MNQRKGMCLTMVFAVLEGLGMVQAQTQTPEEQAHAWLGKISLPAKNYVQDGSFEYGQRWGWFEHKTGGVESGTAKTGKNAFHMVGNHPNWHFYYYQYDVPLETGKTYTFSGWVKAKGVSRWGKDHMSAGAIFLTNYGWSDSVSLKPSGPTFEWTYLTKTFVAMPTKPRPDGKPSYSLTIYWPPKSEGEYWIDDIQIEDGSKATAFTDAYLGDGLVAREKLLELGVRIFATQSALEKFDKSPLIAQLSKEVGAILTQAGMVRDDLKRFNTLPKTTREELSKRIDGLKTRLAGLRTLMWTGPAHITLNEVRMPVKLSETVGIDLTCLKGEHRDLAINLANLTTDGYPARLAFSPLYQQANAEWVSPSRWVKQYTVPLMRGFSKPGEVFTDALPEADQGGIFQVNPAGISQAVISVDTTSLLPGEYRGTIMFMSMVDAANKRQIEVKLRVLPMATLPLSKVEIAECYGHTEYAWEAMVELGVNAFDISSAVIEAYFNDDGTLKNADFTRVDPIIRRALADVPEARFHCISGQGIFSMLTGRYGWKPEEPRFKTAFKAWVKALADHLAAFKVGPERLVIETYDEPGEGDYPTGTNMANWIHEVDPAIRAWFYSTGIVQEEGWKKNALAHDIIGPGVALCTPANMAFAKTLGKTLWVYDCQADGESFEPIAYYRLMPWMCRKYGITGWGHFSWFGSSHGYGRGYRPWEGVETQNLVYPSQDGEGFVISRRFLATRAGHEDYQVLDALDRAMADPKADPKKVEAAKKFLVNIYDQALSLSPRETGYQTHIEPGVPPDLLDRLRQDAVANIAALLPKPTNLETSLDVRGNKTLVQVTLPQEGKLTLRYLVDGKLPWRVLKQKVTAGKTAIDLGDKGEVNRCLVEWCGPDGRLLTGSPLIIPQVRVDSTSDPYDWRKLTDGLRVEAVKFEPENAWVSGPAAVEHWVRIDLEKPISVSNVTLFWMTYTGFPQKTMVQYADGSGAWKPVSATPSFRPAANAVEHLEFTPVTTGSLRILMAPNGGGPGGPSLMGLSEVEVR